MQGSGRTAAGEQVARANERVWARGDLVRSYRNRTLRPVEVLLLARYRDDVSGRVLELGCGAGRITGYLVELAREAHGIDLSEAMIDYCRRRYPAGDFAVGDLLDLSRFADGSLECVVAGYNVLDVLDDADRRSVLRELRRLLVPGGLLLMSSHNRGHLLRVPRPTDLRLVPNPLRLARRLAAMPLFVLNHRRVRHLEREEERYALVNDDAHRYRLVHYYVSRDDQRRQFEEEGFTLLECLDLDGRPVPEGEQAAGCSELHYAARRAA